MLSIDELSCINDDGNDDDGNDDDDDFFFPEAFYVKLNRDEG